MRNPDVDYGKAKKMVRRLVRKGLSRIDAARAAGVSYATARLWTPFKKSHKGNTSISGVTLKILKKLLSDGYLFPDGITQINLSCRTLKKYIHIRKVKLHGIDVFFMDGNERKAMEAFLKRRNFRSLSWMKLAYIRKTFGIKPLKRNDRIMERLRI